VYADYLMLITSAGEAELGCRTNVLFPGLGNVEGWDGGFLERRRVLGSLAALEGSHLYSSMYVP
jgi:hypothetical protein